MRKSKKAPAPKRPKRKEETPEHVLPDFVQEDDGQALGANSMASLAGLADRQMTLEDRIAKGEALLEDLRAQLKQVAEVDIPEVFGNAAKGNVTLQDGRVVKVNPYYGASISKERKVEAHKWFRDTKQGGIIKNELVIVFGKGDDKKVREFQRLAAKNGLTHARNETIHPSTLKSFVKEKLTEGKKLPLELLGVYSGKRATVTRVEKPVPSTDNKEVY